MEVDIRSREAIVYKWFLDLDKDDQKFKEEIMEEIRIDVQEQLHKGEKGDRIY